MSPKWAENQIQITFNCGANLAYVAFECVTGMTIWSADLKEQEWIYRCSRSEK